MPKLTNRFCLARPKAEFPPASALRSLADSEGRLAVRVTPGARSEYVEIVNDRWLVKVRTKPEYAKATAAAIALIAAALGVAPSTIEVMRGASSREKPL